MVSAPYGPPGRGPAGPGSTPLRSSSAPAGRSGETVRTQHPPAQHPPAAQPLAGTTGFPAGARPVLPAQRPDAGLTRPLVSERYCRVTVVLPGGGRVTVSLPSRVPLLEVTQLVVRDLALGDVMLPPVWTLGEVGRPAIAPMATLAEAGVLDGAVLEVRDAAADEVGEALVLDIGEMVHDAEERDGLGRWTPAAATRAVERLGYLGAAVAALTGLTVAVRGEGRAVLGLATAVVGLVLLAAANLRHRGPRPSRGDAVLAAWCAVTVLAVAARYSASAGDLVPRVGVGVALACLLAGAAVPVLPVIGPALAVAGAGITTALLTGTGADPVQSAAVVGTLGALLVTLAPALAGRLGALVPEATAQQLPEPAGPRVPAVRRSAVQARWERAMQSRIAQAVGQVHVVFVTACLLGAALVVGADVVLARATSVYAAVLSGVLALLVLLRAVPARRATDGAVLLVGGAAAALVVLAVLPGRWWPAWVGPVLVSVLVLLAVAVGLSGAGTEAGPAAKPRSASSASSAEHGLVRAARITSVLLVAVAVVLTVGSFEVFEHFWHVGRSL